MTSYLKENYDVIICGAGPAGLYAANCLQKASAGKLSVLLVDKKSPWKEPVACAEAVSRKIFSRYWTPKEEWIRQHLNGVYFTAPDMTRVEYFQKDCGLILNRAAFHHEMADKAAELGVLPLGSDRSGDRFALFGIYVGDYDRCAEIGKTACYRLADALTGARYDRCAAFKKNFVHRITPFFIQRARKPSK